MKDRSIAAGTYRSTSASQECGPAWINVVALVVWVLAGAIVFIPFARDTSPWNAITLHVPGNQGNWWHVLIGMPFFLAFPMIWLRFRTVFSTQPSTVMGRRVLWAAVAISICGTLLVETPFLLHLAGTSNWQRLAVLSLGLGIILVSLAILLLRRYRIAPSRACIAGILTAYLANAALCLVVYSEATGSPWSRMGWMICMAIVWPMFIELVWILQSRPDRLLP